jgi:hypothetical protein
MPGLLDKVRGFVEGQKENWDTARERQAGGGNRNPYLKTDQQQAAIARERAGTLTPPGLSADPHVNRKISQVANRALASKMSSGDPDTVAGSAGMSFDPEDSESVLEMQRSLNAAGITDKFGKSLAEDGMMGEKTLSALRSMQESRGEFIGPEGSDVDALNADYQEDHGRLATNKNPLMTGKNWWDKLTGRTPEEEHIQETTYNENINSDPNSKPQHPRGSGTNRFGTPQGGRFDLVRRMGDADGNIGFAERMGLIKRMDK